MATATVPVVSEQQVQLLTEKKDRLLERARALEIIDHNSKQVAWDLVNGIGELRKEITNDFKESKSAAHKAWKTICEQEAGHLGKLDEPDRILRKKIGDYKLTQRQIEEQRQRDAQAKANREAEERRLDEAIKAEQRGNVELANKILEAPAAPVAVVVPKASVQKVEGEGAMVDDWIFTITDEALIPREYLMVNESAIRAVVKALKNNTNIPGVAVRNEPKPRITGRR